MKTTLELYSGAKLMVSQRSAEVLLDLLNVLAQSVCKLPTHAQYNLRTALGDAGRMGSRIASSLKEDIIGSQNPDLCYETPDLLTECLVDYAQAAYGAVYSRTHMLPGTVYLDNFYYFSDLFLVQGHLEMSTYRPDLAPLSRKDLSRLELLASELKKDYPRRIEMQTHLSRNLKEIGKEIKSDPLNQRN